MCSAKRLYCLCSCADNGGRAGFASFDGSEAPFSAAVLVLVLAASGWSSAADDILARERLISCLYGWRPAGK